MMPVRLAPEAPPSIPARDAEGLVRLLEAAPGVRRRYQFFVWMQTHVAQLLPHAVAVCGAWRRQWRDLEFETFHGVLLDEAAVTQLGGAASVPMAQVADCWLAHGGGPMGLPLAHLQQQAPPGQGAVWQALRGGGLDHLLVHGITRPERPREIESLFAFAAPGMPPDLLRAYYFDLLLPQLHAVYLRMRAVERDIGSAPPRARAVPPGQAPAQWNITEREREILSWVREGRSNQQIGEQLGISALTVKNHIQKILRKMAASNRAQAVSMALTAGLLREDRAGAPSLVQGGHAMSRPDHDGA